MKDNFSFSPEQYAKYRPDYPAAIFDFIYPLIAIPLKSEIVL